MLSAGPGMAQGTRGEPSGLSVGLAGVCDRSPLGFSFIAWSIYRRGLRVAYTGRHRIKATSASASLRRPNGGRASRD